MKRVGNIQGIVWLTLLVAGCTGSDPLPSPGIEPDESGDVCVTLRAGSYSGKTRAIVDEGDTFSPLLLCTDTDGDYKTLRWQEQVDVAADGTVTYSSDIPVYPRYGDFIYITGLYPSPDGGRLNDGVATWTLDGVTDLMYAAQLAGNRWDGFRIQGNTDTSKDRKLEFNHQLTQLQFCAVRQANTVEANEFRITRITLKAVARQASFTVTDVEEKDLVLSYSNPGDLDVFLYKEKDDPSKTVLITSTDPAHPDSVGYVLLPAANRYTANVETTLGTFLSREVSSSDGSFEKGYANRITLHLSEDGLSITGVQLEDWTDEDGGEVNVN